MPRGVIYIWNLKCDTSELILKQKQTHRHGKQTCGCQEGSGVGREGLGV